MEVQKDTKNYWYPTKPWSKITLDNVKFICENYGRMSARQLAKVFNVCQQTIDRILSKNGLIKIHRRYSDHELISEALKYTTKKQFKEMNPKMYDSAYNKGLFDEKITHFRACGNAYNKYVYIYFLTNKRVYVGQTNDITRRHKEHLKSWLKEDEILYTKISKIMQAERVTRLEELLRRRYVSHKFTVLNKIKCSLPGGAFKWDKRRCQLEAARFSSRSEWQKSSPGSYLSARRNGWFSELSSHFISQSELMARALGKRVQCVETDQIFSSLQKAADHFNLNRKLIAKAIRQNKKYMNLTFIEVPK